MSRIVERWYQPSNEGKRIVAGLVLTLSALAACIWALSQLIPYIIWG